MKRDHDEAESLVRRAVRVYSQQLDTLQRLMVEYRNELPRISDKALSLEAPPSVLEAFALALDHATEELPALVEALAKAALATPEGLAVEHRATLSALEAARLPPPTKAASPQSLKRPQAGKRL